MGKLPDYVGILTRWQSTCAKDKYMFGLGMTLAFRCFFMKNKGVFQDGREKLNNEIERGLIGVTADEARRILEGDSELWHWEGRNLHIDLYSKVLQESMEARSRAGKRAVSARWAKSVENKSDNTNVCTNVNTFVIQRKKEKDFPSENLSNGGCSPEGTHPAIDDSVSDDDSAPLSTEETKALFEQIRRDLAADTEQASNQSETDGSEAKSTPETKNALELP